MSKHAPGFLKLVSDAKTRVKEYSITDVKSRLDAGETFQIIDVREESEFAAGHLPGAVHLSKGIIERDIEAKFPNLAEPIVVYCQGGYRSVLVADNLQKMGYTQVFSMDGGFRGWNDKNYPVSTS